MIKPGIDVLLERGLGDLRGAALGLLTGASGVTSDLVPTLTALRDHPDARLVALFGAPLPLDDCAGSAVAAALEMVELIEEFNHERKAVDKAAIRIGIGVATGDVVAGYTGTQQRATYTCIGDTMNLAALEAEYARAAAELKALRNG